MWNSRSEIGCPVDPQTLDPQTRPHSQNLDVGTYANDTDVSVDRPAEIPTEITYTPYNTICSLLVPVIRGVFRVAPPIYRTDDPPNNEKSLGTFPVAALAHVRRAEILRKILTHLIIPDVRC